MNYFKTMMATNLSSWERGQHPALQNLLIKACQSNNTIVDSDCQTDEHIFGIYYQPIKSDDKGIAMGCWLGIAVDEKEETAVTPSHIQCTQIDDPEVILGCPNDLELINKYDVILSGLFCFFDCLKSCVANKLFVIDDDDAAKNSKGQLAKKSYQKPKVHLIYNSGSEPLIRYLQLVANANPKSNLPESVAGSFLLSITLLDKVLAGYSKTHFEKEEWRKYVTGLVANILCGISLSFEKYDDKNIVTDLNAGDVRYAKTVTKHNNKFNAFSFIDKDDEKGVQLLNKVGVGIKALIALVESMNKVDTKVVMPSKVIN